MSVELEEKRRKLEEIMDRHNLDAVVLSSQANFSWASGGGRAFIVLGEGDRSGAGSLLFRKGQATPILLADTIEARRLAEEEVAAWQPEIALFPWYDPAQRQPVLRKIAGSGRIGTDDGMQGTLDVGAELKAARMTLTPLEIERYHSLGQATGKALESVMRTKVAPGMSEVEIAGNVAQALYAVDSVPLVILVATDDRVFRRRHPLPIAAKILEKYAMVVVCGIQYGLVASCTRLVHFGPIDDELQNKLEACAYVDATYAHYTQPGASAGEVFARGQAAYAERGYAGEWQLHHQGGATGYLTREWVARPDSTDQVVLNGAFAWNPSITGIKTEDTFVLTESGPLWLTETGAWPSVTVQVGDTTYTRPAILEQ